MTLQRDTNIRDAKRERDDDLQGPEARLRALIDRAKKEPRRKPNRLVVDVTPTRHEAIMDICKTNDLKVNALINSLLDEYFER